MKFLMLFMCVGAAGSAQVVTTSTLPGPEGKNQIFISGGQIGVGEAVGYVGIEAALDEKGCDQGSVLRGWGYRSHPDAGRWQAHNKFDEIIALP